MRRVANAITGGVDHDSSADLAASGRGQCQTVTVFAIFVVASASTKESVFVIAAIEVVVATVSEKEIARVSIAAAADDVVVSPAE